jgi:hypothetical protein
MKRFFSLLLATILALPGCATSRAQTRTVPTPSQPGAGDHKVMADYVRQLRVGSRIRLTRTDGDEIRGILMKNDGDPLVVQRRARIPEAPIEVPIREVVAVELDTGSSKGSVGRAIAIGAGAAAAAVLGIFVVFAAIYSD